MRYTGLPRAALAAALLASPSVADEPASFPSGGGWLADSILPGVAGPERDVVLGAPMDGLLARVSVERGQWVEEGDVLAVMDDEVARAAVELAAAEAANDAEVLRARRTLELARLSLSRTEEACRNGAANQTELENQRVEAGIAEAALQAATERRELARLRLRLAEARLERHLVRAPFRGQVVRLEADAGSVLQLGAPVLRLVASDRLEIEMSLPAAWFHRLEVGRDYRFSAGAPIDGPVVARLVYRADRLDAALSGVRCVFLMDNAGEAHPSGFVVTPRLEAPVSAADGADADPG